MTDASLDSGARPARRRRRWLVALGIASALLVVTVGLTLYRAWPLVRLRHEHRLAGDDCLKLDAPSASVPLEIRGGKLLARGHLNGHGPLLLMVDTGAPVNAVDVALADEMRLAHPTRSPTRIGIGSFGVVDWRAVRTVRSLELGSARMGRHLAVDLDLAPMNSALDIDMAGVVGLDTLRQVPVTLDMPGRMLTFHARDAFQPRSGSREYALLLHDRRIGVRAAFPDGRDRDLMLDTGLNERLVLSSTDAAGFVTDVAESLMTTQGSVAGAKGLRRARATGVVLFGRALGDIAVGLVDEDSAGFLSGWHGMLGLPAVDELVLQLDIAGGRIWVSDPSETSPRPPSSGD